MKSLTIPFSSDLELSKTPTLIIENYKWVNNDYKPLVEVFLCHDNVALKVQFVAHEKEISCKEKNDNGRIWCDSCVEMFIMPFEDDKRYINFEINPIGAMIMSIGENRSEREPLVYKYKKDLSIKTKIYKNKWTAEMTIPFKLLNKIYDNNSKLSPKANFYKCGDESQFPHFGMWNDIPAETADFHRPEYFLPLILE